jgi:hypothetical protein
MQPGVVVACLSSQCLGSCGRKIKSSRSKKKKKKKKGGMSKQNILSKKKEFKVSLGYLARPCLKKEAMALHFLI